MIVVADASPINYLILIGHVDVLPKLFDRVILPLAVQRELLHEGSPPLVKTWASQIPPWSEIIAVVDRPDPDLKSLDAGERAAIQLAIEPHADNLLINDRFTA